ncbi:WxL protein peptidoglycan domain-containing protein [Actinocorallia longicatena]|uniref:WxL Interacting Protein peptidoglycan binding domain-containing protein n=1 Tax=Actinocorallia longicatena TaxID=111803 RepID=A0ABP6Q8X2_9ACTN
MITPWVVAAGLVLAPVPDFSWSVQPSGPKGPTGRDYFVYSAEPGQTVRDTVGITNRSTKPLTFRVYPSDAFTTEDGSFALLTADKPATDLGSWIKVGGATVTVRPGKRADLPFTLTIPRDATPGDHTGGVLAAVTEQRPTGGGQRVNVDRRVAARVYLRVNGPLTSNLAVDRISASHDGPLVGDGTVTVTYRVRNTGNVRLKARAHVSAEAPFAWPQGTPADREIPELLPGSSMTFTDRVPGVLPAGPLKASVRLTPADPEGVSPTRLAATSRTAGFWAVPWAVLGAAALVLLLLGRRRPRRRRA